MKGPFVLAVLLMCMIGFAQGEKNANKGRQACQEKFEEATRLVKAASRLVCEADSTDILLWEGNSFLEDVNAILDSEESCITGGLFEHREYKVVYADENIASFRLEKTTYTGGMHPNMVVAVGTVVRGRKEFPLKLEDIMTPEQIPQMTALIRQALRKHFAANTDDELDKHLSRTNKPEPTQNFYYDDKGLHFVYNEYEIACYATGMIDVCIQWPRPLCALERPQGDGKGEKTGRANRQDGSRPQ
ncbi:MAG: DUF3298 domain-containing protein [Victivallales bacterium]|nr:DUF3298 domain-containing protein [Victivallales bacterium]